MTTSSNLNIEHLEANLLSPEVPVNEAYDLIDSCVSDQVTINFASDADLTLSTTGAAPQQWQYLSVKLTDTGVVLTTSRNVIVPTNKKTYLVYNETAQPLTVKTSAGTGVVVSASGVQYLYCDGTNVVDGHGHPDTVLFDVPVTITATVGSVLDVSPVITNNTGIGISAIKCRPTFSGNGDFSFGLDATPNFSPSASIGEARGFNAAAVAMPGSGVTITDVYGGVATVTYDISAAGTVTTGYGFSINAPGGATGTLKPTTHVGLKVKNQGKSGITTSYGIYCDAQSGSTNNYAAVLLGGNVGLGTAAPTALLDINSDIIRLRTSKTPSSATDTGNAGDIAWDSNYIYVCVTTNSWKRSAIAAW